MIYTIGGPNALTQHIFDGSTTPLCGQSFGDGFQALLEEKGAPPKTLESEMNRDGADAAIAVGLCENCREKYAENESGEIAEVFQSMGDDRASVESDPAADDELVTDGGTKRRGGGASEGLQKCDMPDCYNEEDLTACRDPGDEIVKVCPDCLSDIRSSVEVME